MSSTTTTRPLGAHDRVLRDRVILARGLERAITGPEGRGAIRSLYPVIRPTVAAACRPALVRVASTLRDPSTEVGAEAIAAVRALLADGASSPLYGSSIDAAVATVSALEERVAA